jgi:hypothetical protein
MPHTPHPEKKERKCLHGLQHILSMIESMSRWSANQRLGDVHPAETKLLEA